MTKTRTIIDFEKLIKESTVDQLKSNGFKMWDEDIILIPGTMYDDIPEGMELVSINNEKKIFKRGITDNDIRFGCLAYGFNVKALMRDEKIDTILKK